MNLAFTSFLKFLKLDNSNKTDSFIKETQTKNSKDTIIKQHKDNLQPMPYKIETKKITTNNGSTIITKEITTEQIPINETESQELTSEKITTIEPISLRR